MPGLDAEQVQARQQALATAAAGLRSERSGASLRLDELVREAAFDYLQDVHPLIIDAEGLARAGIGPATMVTVRPAGPSGDRAMPWEEVGLVALPCEAGVVLTARGAAPGDPEGEWGGGLPSPGRPIEDLSDAVA